MKTKARTVHEDRIINRAELADPDPEKGNGQCCLNHLLFAMRDQHHEFTIGITTILECLIIAERQGAVPELPDGWVNEVVNHYDLHVPAIEVASTSPRIL